MTEATEYRGSYWRSHKAFLLLSSVPRGLVHPGRDGDVGPSSGPKRVIQCVEGFDPLGWVEKTTLSPEEWALRHVPDNGKVLSGDLRFLGWRARPTFWT